MFGIYDVILNPRNDSIWNRNPISTARCAGEHEAGHHFAARVNRHAKTHLRFASENMMSRLASDHQPLCFMQRQDRASHRSGWSRVAAPLFPNTHRSSWSPSRCASCVAQSLGLKAHPFMARSACGPAYNTGAGGRDLSECWLEANPAFRPTTASVINRRRAWDRTSCLRAACGSRHAPACAPRP
jgi:hypothetical protein